ncbi:hypothetical protein FRB94_005590 [Tulasnella sp. JGI-2019a]|nr:hypothetical protein FRB94_005590 [Tulasnella sp. JGI-2019a]
MCNTVVASHAQTFEYELPPQGIQPACLKLIDSGNGPIFFAFLRRGPFWIPFLSTEGIIKSAGGSANVWALTRNELTLSFTSNLVSSPTNLILQFLEKTIVARAENEVLDVYQSTRIIFETV